MKKILLFILIFFSCFSYSQLFENQKFCKESKGISYFPLEITKKKILWQDTFYFEIKNKTKVINGKTYVEFKQEWNNSESFLLYFREENKIIYQYDLCSEKETIRYNPKFKIGHLWKSASEKSEYQLITYNGKLKTPYCEYENLLVIKAKMPYGKFNFYYLKGQGYIGATKNNKLVSYVTPKW